MKIRLLIALCLLVTSVPLLAQIEVVSGGRVGIGATSPANKLEVVDSTTANGSIARLTRNSKTLEFYTESVVDLEMGTPGNHSLGFYTNNNISALVISTAQNVGVGTTTPGYKLDVNGVANATDFRGTVGATTPSTVAGTVVTASNRVRGAYLIGTGALMAYDSSSGAAYLGFTGGGVYLRSVADNSGTAAPMVLQIGNGNNALTISAALAMRFNGYGAGTLTTDSSGNLTATSDARAKDTVADFTTGLGALRQLQPKKFHWKKETGLNTDDLNVSVYAQDLLAAGIPEAVFTQRTVEDTEDVLVDGVTQKRRKLDAQGEPLTRKVDATYYTVSDRAVISVLINAVKELAAKNDALEARIAALEAK